MTSTHDLRIEMVRAYDEPGAHDGYRALVDRLWPRGVRKEALELDEWCRDVAPSKDLRDWFHHEPERFAEFRERYLHELADSDEPAALLERVAGHRRLTLVYGAKDEERNNAVVLREYLKSLR